ncbi:MAG: fabD [Sphingomonas bacterium]|uniref:ACP S-malonyltransferase n=1 Tax=Sphingomonas bacterium TaxID=1895847 RepID=UPI002606EFB1|nr:ACP S-malonyltransferase [Sphingomonas bacterium]MDB5696815.1 fabD [Sphingomonas bacterium]
MRAFIFPGQGSQAVGMGKALADASVHAREVLQEVDDALGQSLSRLMADGPAEELMLTENAQPAIMANAIATLRVLEREGGMRLAEKCDYVAGHSLGEYTALCAAGAFDLATTARLLRTRGEAMQEAVPVGQGAMAVLLGCNLELAHVIAGAAVDAILAEGGEELVCTVANDNDPTQVVISGHLLAIERAVPLAKELGAKRALLLPVSAPFHCALMQPAAEVMENALLDADLRAPLVPVYCNVDAAPIASPGMIRVALVQQVTGMVRWRESVLAMAAAGVTEFVEIGGKVLGPMVKRIVPDASAISVVTMDDAEALAKAF